MPNLIERLDALSEAVGAVTDGDTLSRMANGHRIALECVDFIREHGPTLREALRDAERLDWLDQQNRPASMGWKVSRAPYGNVAVSSVIELGGKRLTPIREAIDACTATAHMTRQKAL